MQRSLFEKEITRPARLKKGDTIGIVAPACPFDPDKFKKGVEKLKELGYKVKYELMIFKKYWSMAGHDSQRANQINRMFADREVKAIFCAQAGYGSIRTIPYLDWDVIRKHPKIFVGYSDITVLLSGLYKVGRMVVFHGPVVSSEIHDKMNPRTLEYLLRAISTKEPLGEITFSGMRSLRPGRASGTLVGGNMSLLVCMVGTAYDIDTRGKIIFLEDIGEDLEIIDKYLMHLKLAGKFRGIKGLVFGKMIDCVDFAGRTYNIRNVLNDILHDVDVPMLYGFPSGHRVPGTMNVTLPLGVRVTIDADELKVTVEESGVN